VGGGDRKEKYKWIINILCVFPLSNEIFCLMCEMYYNKILMKNFLKGEIYAEKDF